MELRDFFTAKHLGEKLCQIESDLLNRSPGRFQFYPQPLLMDCGKSKKKASEFGFLTCVSHTPSHSDTSRFCSSWLLMVNLGILPFPRKCVICCRGGGVLPLLPFLKHRNHCGTVKGHTTPVWKLDSPRPTWLKSTGCSAAKKPKL